MCFFASTAAVIASAFKRATAAVSFSDTLVASYIAMSCSCIKVGKSLSTSTKGDHRRENRLFDPDVEAFLHLVYYFSS